MDSDREVLHECPFCPDKAFRSEQSLQYHLGLAHLDPDGSMVSEDLPEPWHESSDEQMEEESNPIQKVGDKFVCTQCPDRPEFNQRGHLWKHIYRRHQTEKRIKCEVCGKGLLDKHSYTEHMRRHLGDKPFQCTLCKAGFVARYILQAHMVTHNNRGELVYRTKFACKWCHMSFNARLPLNNHILAKHLAECVLNPSDPENPFSCVICDGFTGENANDLTTHLTEHVQAQSGNSVTAAIHTCDVCGRTYKHKRHLNRHAKSHMGIKPFECDICGKRFTEAFDLGEHRRIHDAIKTVPCPYCDKCFPSNIRRNEHVRKKHSEEKPYHCPRCPEKFSDFRSEANHRMDVHGEKNLIHECWKCGKTYVNADRHRKHESICVGGEKASKKERKANGEMATSLYSESYDCGVCGRSYTQRKHLNRHTKSHKSGRSHSCEICGTSFYEAHRLQEHKRIHDKKRRFDCTYCEKNFSSSWRRNEHERKAHHEEKTFKCPSCPERFSDIRSKALHRMEVHEEQNLIHECSKCSRVYTKADRLKKHEAVCVGKASEEDSSNKEADDVENDADEEEQPESPAPVRRRKKRKAVPRRKQPSRSKKLEKSAEPRNDDTEEKTASVDPKVEVKQEPLDGDIWDASGLPVRTVLLEETDAFDAEATATVIPKVEISNDGSDGSIDIVPCSESQEEPPEAVGSSHSDEEEPTDPVPSSQSDNEAQDSDDHQDTEEHLTLSDAPMLLQCAECPKAFIKPSSLARHKRIHNRGKIPTCNLCGQTYRKSSHLTRHMKRHTGEKPFVCHDCGRAFSESWQLRKHEPIHQPNREQLLCNVCAKGFVNTTTLRRHQLNSHGLGSSSGPLAKDEKRFLCCVCSKGFNSPSSLVRHENLHTGLKSLKCPYCPKSFFDPSNLKCHIRIHTGERPFRCTQCPKSFTIKSNLQNHERIHTGEKPFRCQVCGRAFSHSSTLRTHKRIHTGEGTSRKKNRFDASSSVNPKIPFLQIQEDELLRNSESLNARL